MRYSGLIILLYFNMVFGLRGKLGSICYSKQRYTRPVKTDKNTTKNLIAYRRIEWCCDGYKERNGVCEAQCDQTCVHGICTKPNVCTCAENYNGTLCEIRSCPAGYKGLKCEEKCSKYNFGQNCKEKCVCQNGHCDPINGYCHCDAGWTGDACSNKCSNGTYGQNCSVKCACQHDGICDPINGTCECQSGFIGQNCKERCKEGYWGYNCTNSCDCPKNKCNPKDGTCDIVCKNGVYINDTCECDEGWTGEVCSEILCPNGFYGDDCENICFCDRKTTKICERQTGSCICKPGWSGEKCEESCLPMTFGENCTYTCDCMSDNYNGCDPISGKCYCKPGWAGEFCEIQCKCKNGNCDNMGKCDCDPGWQGDNCDKECENGYFGKGCNSLCVMFGLGNNICDPVLGPICKVGFSVESNCNLECPEGTYGIGCKNCSCENANGCNRVTGICECLPGWFGTKCENKCPDFYYGVNCNSTCKCRNCRPTDGFCKCQEGWNGEYCQDYCPENYFNASSNQCIDIDGIILIPVSTKSLYAASITLAAGILSICTFFFIIFYFMKKKDKEDSMDHRRRTSSNTYIERLSHIYEELPERPEQDQYNTLLHIPVEDGYLIPRDMSLPTYSTNNVYSTFNIR